MRLPDYLQLEPVGQCNLKCQMCPIQYRTDGQDHARQAFMRWELFQSIVEQFPELRRLHLQGLGEPMMHPRFFEMVEFATARGIQVTTNTNLTLLSDRRARRCVTSGLNCAHVSIDGATAETYERIRVNGRYSRVTANLGRLVDAKRELQSQTPEIRIVVVLMRQNLHELTDLVELAAGWGVQSVFVQHLCHDFSEASLPEKYRPMRDFVDEQTLVSENQQRIASHFELARRRATELGIELRLPMTVPKRHPAGTPGKGRCDWPWTGAYFSYEGRSMPCCMISTPDRTNFGTAADSSVEDIWNGADYESFRTALESESPPSVCQSCSVYQGVF